MYSTNIAIGFIASVQNKSQGSLSMILWRTEIEVQFAVVLQLYDSEPVNFTSNDLMYGSPGRT